MSSKFDSRPKGSDGSDFRHRQKVANHYKDSVVNKFRLKFVLSLHCMLLFLLILKVSEDLLDQFSVDFGPLERLNVPTPHFWEYWWLLSFVPVVIAFYALPKNNAKMMSRAYYGFFFTALLPVAFGAGYSLPLLIKFSSEHGAVDQLVKFLNVPLVVLEYAFYAVAFQVHVFTMYFATQLMKAWNQKSIKTSAKPKADKKAE